jgi:hypothetical protein
MELLAVPGIGRDLAAPAGLFAAAGAAAAAWAAAGESRLLAIAAVSLALTGVLELGRVFVGIQRCRRKADEWLRSARGRFVPAAYGWRAAQLTSAAQRHMLARTLRRIAGTAQEPTPWVKRPLLIAARRRPAELETLATALETEAEPVTPAGMLRVVELVRDGTGPLWGSSDEALVREVEATLELLRPAA